MIYLLSRECLTDSALDHKKKLKKHSRKSRLITTNDLKRGSFYEVNERFIAYDLVGNMYGLQ